MAEMLNTRLRSFTSQNWDRPQEELSPLLVFADDQPVTTPTESVENRKKAESESLFRIPSASTQSRPQKVQQKQQQGSSARQEKEPESTVRVKEIE